MANPRTFEKISSRFDGMQFVVETEKEAKVYEIEYLVAVMLVAVARSDGHIDQSESDKMLQLVSEYFHLRSSTSLDLLGRAVKDLANDPDLGQMLRGWSTVLTSTEKEDIAVMMLKIVAADGNRDAEEMTMLSKAAAIIDISPESLHIAYRRYFSESDWS
jgi:uncharacterized tellurite resistance protein B-like protein